MPAGCEHTFGAQGTEVTAKFGHTLEQHAAPWKDPRVNSAESSPAKVLLLCQMLIKASVKGCGLSNVAKEWTSFFLLRAKECEFEKSHLNLVTLPSYDFGSK